MEHKNSLHPEVLLYSSLSDEIKDAAYKQLKELYPGSNADKWSRDEFLWNISDWIDSDSMSSGAYWCWNFFRDFCIKELQKNTIEKIEKIVRWVCSPVLPKWRGYSKDGYLLIEARDIGYIRPFFEHPDIPNIMLQDAFYDEKGEGLVADYFFRVDKFIKTGEIDNGDGRYPLKRR